MSYLPLRSVRSGERGSVLILVVVLVLMLAGLSFGLFVETVADRTSVRHNETSHAALDLAETGITRAEMEIRSLVDTDGDGVGTIAGALGGGTFEVTATQDATNPDRYVLVAEGEVGLSVRRIEVGIRRRAKQKHVEGLYAKEILEFGGGSQTDAYDSRSGTYASQAVNTDAAGSYADTGGSVGSGMGLKIVGSASTVRGNAIPGPFQQVEVTGDPVVWGDTLARQEAIELDEVPFAEFENALYNNQNAQLLGTPSLGDGATAIADVSDTALNNLTDASLDTMEEVPVLLQDDATLDTLTYDDVLAEAYETALNVDATAMTESTSEATDTYVKLDDSGGTYYQLYPDGDVLYDETGSTSTTSTAPTRSTGASGTPRAGRISYDATSKTLRATAGAAVVLNGGTYFFSDFTLVGRAHLVVRGPSKIYVTGSFDLGGGGIINESGNPGDLQVFVHPHPLPAGHTPTTTEVKIRGGSEAAAAIYAPEADVTVGGGDDFFGSIVGRNITVKGNVRFHYDKALGDLSGTATLERLYWRELTLPPR